MNKKIAALAQDIAVDIKLDIYGSILSVENWEEVRDYLLTALDSVKNEFGMPEMAPLFIQMRNTFQTKAAIESLTIQDAQQYHNFHGGRYELNDTISGQILLPNNYDDVVILNLLNCS